MKFCGPEMYRVANKLPDSQENKNQIDKSLMKIALNVLNLIIQQIYSSKAEVTNMRPAGCMRPAKEFRTARKAFRQDQQS